MCVYPLTFLSNNICVCFITTSIHYGIVEKTIFRENCERESERD